MSPTTRLYLSRYLFATLLISGVAALSSCGKDDGKAGSGASSSPAGKNEFENYGTGFQGDITQAAAITKEQFDAGIETLKKIDAKSWAKINQKAFLEIRLIKAESQSLSLWSEVTFLKYDATVDEMVSFLLRQPEKMDPEVVRVRSIMAENKKLERQIREKPGMFYSIVQAVSHPEMYHQALLTLSTIKFDELGIKQFDSIWVSEGDFVDAYTPTDGNSSVVAIKYSAKQDEVIAHLKKQKDYKIPNSQ